LNRNFDSEWSKKFSSSDDECSETYAGPRVESELETKSIAKFFRSKSYRGQNFLSYISLHAFGGVWLYWNEKSKLEKHQFLSVCKKPLIAIRSMRDRFNISYEFGLPGTVIGCK
jgi:hypothetical protein